MLLRHLEGVTECIQESRMNDDDYPEGRPLNPKEKALHSIFEKVCEIYLDLEKQAKLNQKISNIIYIRNYKLIFHNKNKK